jgi:hypothetical protein
MSPQVTDTNPKGLMVLCETARGAVAGTTRGFIAADTVVELGLLVRRAPSLTAGCRPIAAPARPRAGSGPDLSQAAPWTLGSFAIRDYARPTHAGGPRAGSNVLSWVQAGLGITKNDPARIRKADREGIRTVILHHELNNVHPSRHRRLDSRG